jgi:DNA-binding HxlR family transcriptional regulator
MNENCTIYRTADFIGKRWTLVILLELYKGEEKIKRYSELKRRLPGITSKILSTRLRELEEHKLITKKVDAREFPVKCEYSLSKSGQDFIKIIQDMKEWALTWNIHNNLCDKTKCQDCLG